MTATTRLTGPAGEPSVVVSYTMLLAWERRRWVRRDDQLRCEGAATPREWVLTERGRAWAAEDA